MGLAIAVGGRPVLGPGELSAIVAVVMLTTLATPPPLRWRLGRRAPVDGAAAVVRTAST